MTTVVRALPCSVCGAAPGERCTGIKGQVLAKSHHRRTPPAACGTGSGYRRHLRLGTEPCDACRDAARREMAEYRQKNPDVRERDIVGLERRREATRLLIQRHEAEFRQLLSVLSEAAS